MSPSIACFTFVSVGERTPPGVDAAPAGLCHGNPKPSSGENSDRAWSRCEPWITPLKDSSLCLHARVLAHISLLHQSFCVQFAFRMFAAAVGSILVINGSCIPRSLVSLTAAAFHCRQSQCLPLEQN